jgi:hypothetical protein
MFNLERNGLLILTLGEHDKGGNFYWTLQAAFD